MEATGSPVVSATSTETVSPLCRTTRIRTAEAPVACSATLSQENGTTPRSTPLNATTCRAASSSAGWSPYADASPSASAGRATSANTSSPRRQAVRSPWKWGP